MQFLYALKVIYYVVTCAPAIIKLINEVWKNSDDRKDAKDCLHGMVCAVKDPVRRNQLRAK